MLCSFRRLLGIGITRSVCAGCPSEVRDACLRMALDAERGASIYERHGVFGGTVPSERLRMQKEAS